jgi:preprotein translocase subunit YajC
VIYRVFWIFDSLGFLLFIIFQIVNYCVLLRQQKSLWQDHRMQEDILENDKIVGLYRVFIKISRQNWS